MRCCARQMGGDDPENCQDRTSLARCWFAVYPGLTLPIRLQTAIRACVAGGKLVVVGLGAEEAKLPVASAACKEIDIIGSFRYANTVRLHPMLIHPQDRIMQQENYHSWTSSTTYACCH